LSLRSVPDLGEAAATADCVVIVTDHKAIDYKMLADRAMLIFDTRNVMARHGLAGPKVAKL
jgi:UDP-N-acetyl-D-glucosamine dehydrogenase